MYRSIKSLLLLLIPILTLSCEGDCTKTITHPELTIYIPGGGTQYYPAQNQEVPCDDPGPIAGELGLNVPYLQNMSVEILEFNFTPDTGNNTSRLQFEIKIHNQTNTDVQGAPILVLLVDGEISTANLSAQASNPCLEIAANSSCIFTYDKQTYLDLGYIESIYLSDVKYVLRR